MERHPLDPRVRTMWQVVAVAATAPLWLGLLVGAAVAAANAEVLLGGALAAGSAAVAALALGLPMLHHRRWSWALTDEGLELAHGVLVRTESAIPTFRVQQVDVRQGPIERAFGLVTLRITTASSGSDGTLPGIGGAEADDVRRRILDRVAADDGV